MKNLAVLNNIDQIKPGMKEVLFGDIKIAWEHNSTLKFDSEKVSYMEHWEILHEVILHVIENKEFKNSVAVHLFLIRLVELNIPESIMIDLLKHITNKSKIPMYALRKDLADIRRNK